MKPYPSQITSFLIFHELIIVFCLDLKFYEFQFPNL